MQIIKKFIFIINLIGEYLLFQFLMKNKLISKQFESSYGFLINNKKTQPQRDSNPQPYDPKSHALSIAP